MICDSEAIPQMQPIYSGDFDKVRNVYGVTEEEDIRKACRVFFAKNLAEVFKVDNKNKKDLMIGILPSLPAQSQKIIDLGLNPVNLVEENKQDLTLSSLEYKKLVLALNTQ